VYVHIALCCWLDELYLHCSVITICRVLALLELLFSVNAYIILAFHTKTLTDKEAQQEAAKANNQVVNVDNNGHHRAMTESHRGWHKSHGEVFKFVKSSNDHNDHHNDHHGHSHNGWHNAGGFSNGHDDLNHINTDSADLDGIHGVGFNGAHSNSKHLLGDADHLSGGTHFSDVNTINSFGP
jgi:hypothetical protein